jgi:F-type H+-transporting ATPase subunit epsilon
MANLLEAQILTPHGPAFKGKAVGVVLPGTQGRFEVLANHAPLMSALEPGLVVIRSEAESKALRFAVSGGFVDVNANAVVVMVEAAESPEQIDVSRAEAALNRAKTRLASRESGMDAARAEASLSRAMNRLKVAAR